MIFADDAGGQQRDGLLMRALLFFNVGRKGTLVPLSVKPLPGAIPQVVSLPPLPSATKPTDDAAEPYFVAYSTVPQVRECTCLGAHSDTLRERETHTHATHVSRLPSRVRGACICFPPPAIRS